MNIELFHNNVRYTCDLNKPLDISLPLKHGEENPNCFWADPVKIETIRVGDFVGSVAEGGSVNYQKIVMTPHGNGTHTECYGHISAEETAQITNCLKTFHSVALLVSIPVCKKENGDEYIALDAFNQAIGDAAPEAIVIRTLPNNETKLNQKYSGTNPPYLDPEITKLIRDRNIQHLLIDLPSVDREIDGGALTAHKNFWNFDGEISKESTITELIFVDNSIEDGLYLLNLQIPSIVLDAVPSKPVLYKLQLMQ